MLAAIVPAHDEELLIGSCLASLQRAARHPQLLGEPAMVVVVLDACTDRTGEIARSLGASVTAVSARNVGVARAHGARIALQAGARWMAFTDADTTVADDWLALQLAQRSDAVCGTVEVRDWHAHDEAVRLHHEAHYADRHGHRHVHGANLGVAARAYANAGGFQALPAHEDVALVKALARSGASICWSAAPRVVTSARRLFRAAGGFGETLIRIERELAPLAALVPGAP